MEDNKQEASAPREPEIEGGLTDRDFFDQACAYFYYHAGQRMNMINYFIAVFGAALALYGSLLSVYTIASVMIAVFLVIISLLFYFIDLRNRFDVKESQRVIEQFERKYGYHIPKGSHAYGVFSNENSVFRYYGRSARREIVAERGEEYRALVRAKKKNDSKLPEMVKAFLEKDGSVSEKVLIESLDQRPLFTLSGCIRVMYLLSTVIGIIGAALAIAITAGFIKL